MCGIATKYRDVAEFLFVYTGEAHAADGWRNPVGKYQVNQHRNLDDRSQAAKAIFEDYSIPCPFVIDSFDDPTTWAYGSNPDRLYIIENSQIVYQGKCGPYGYHVDEVETWLQRYNMKLK